MDGSSATATSVKVLVRIRPAAPSALLSNHYSSTCQITSPSTLTYHPPIAASKEGFANCSSPSNFEYDSVLGPGINQEQVWSTCTGQGLIEDFLKGINCSILAYGQTGTGKTYTIGTDLRQQQDDAIKIHHSAGLIPRTIDEVLKAVEQKAAKIASESGPGTEDPYLADLYATFVEIYNEEIKDLLGCTGIDRTNGKIVNCTLREVAGEIILTGVKEERVPITGNSRTQIMSQIMHWLNRGCLARTTKSTGMNVQSSRSHAILTLTLRQTQLKSRGLVSKLCFVDLAGSERMSRLGLEDGKSIRAKESISINSGLLALGNVIGALASVNDNSGRRKPPHIPYRDSKLTRLLQDCLGGNSRTCMIACISPSAPDGPETLNTLRYAQRARAITNVTKVNELSRQEDELAQLRRQVAALKAELLTVRQGKRIDPGCDDDVTMTEAYSQSSSSSSSLELLEWKDKYRSLQAEHQTMQSNYEDRLKLLQATLEQASQQRDQAMQQHIAARALIAQLESSRTIGKARASPVSSKPTNQSVSSSNASKLQQMEKLNLASKQTITTLKASIKHLQTRLETATSANRSTDNALQDELTSLRLQSLKLQDASKKAKRAYDFQATLLARKAEALKEAKQRIAHLLTLLRKHRLQPNNENPVDGLVVIDDTEDNIDGQVLLIDEDGDIPMTSIQPFNQSKNGERDDEEIKSEDDDNLLIQRRKPVKGILSKLNTPNKKRK